MKLVRGAELLRKAEDILLTGSGKAKRVVVPTEGRLARGGAGQRGAAALAERSCAADGAGVQCSRAGTWNSSAEQKGHCLRGQAACYDSASG